MIMKTYISGPIDANNYLLWDDDTKDALLIDCSDFEEEIISDVKENKLNVKYILLTHGHFDHVLGLNRMKVALGAQTAIHKGDKVMLENINEFARFFDFPPVEQPKIDFFIEDGEILEAGGIKIKVLYTPGHTEGGSAYIVENKIFSGDTLFKDCYGRTDLFGGDFKKIKHSLKEVLFKLDDNMEVFPGHGESTTIGLEKLNNAINR